MGSVKRRGRRLIQKEERAREKTAYEILGLAEAASFDEIRQAYLQKVRLSPPEKDPEGFREARKAYGQLKDGAKKKMLDLSMVRRVSGLGVNTATNTDLSALFRERIFLILLASSDLYVKDFSLDFRDLDREIGELR